ncbi:MAG TPA: hypothetical protein VIR55_06565 [Ignavibacteria bacterium]
MLENFRFKLGLLYIQLKFRKKKDSMLNFTKFIREDSRILIFMPEDPLEFEEAKDAIMNLKKDWPNLQPTLLVRSHFSAINDLDKLYKIFPFSSLDINKFYLPKKSFRNIISDYNYDLVIDFNKEINLLSSYIAKKVNVKYRISFVKDFSDKFYNFQFNPNSVTHNKNIYSSLMKKLKMFCYKEA